MPMGRVGADRVEQYLPLSLVRTRLERHFTFDEILIALADRHVMCSAGDRRKLGFITR